MKKLYVLSLLVVLGVGCSKDSGSNTSAVPEFGGPNLEGEHEIALTDDSMTSCDSNNTARKFDVRVQGGTVTYEASSDLEIDGTENTYSITKTITSVTPKILRDGHSYFFAR